MHYRAMLASLLLACSAVAADVRLAKVFTDHMVLQRDKPVAVWGFADPGDKVSVTFAGHETKAGTDNHGRWQVHLPAMKANAKGAPLTVKSDDSTITLRDVLVGDVWVCGGQSNMGRPVNGDQIKSADLPLVRLFNVSGDTPRKEGIDDTFGWAVCTPDVIARAGDGKADKRRGFTEVGFVFGRHLHQELGVPIGLFQMNCGGSKAKDWTPTPGAAEKLTLGEPVQLKHNPGRLYEVRMRGTTPMTVRGAVWYQGEDDGRNSQYGQDFTDMIAAWRKAYRDPKLPFYFAQIAQTTYASGMLKVWEGQSHVFNTVPHTGYAVSNDIYVGTRNGGFKERTDPRSGMPIAGGSNPHPTGKDKVALRLARIALHETYSRDQGVIYGPMFASHETVGGKVRVTFKHVGDGLKTNDGRAPNWFEVSDGKQERGVTIYVPAQAKIVGKDTVEVWADGVPAPKHVRFGWHPLARFNLINAADLPAVSFRTDRDGRWRVMGQK